MESGRAWERAEEIVWGGLGLRVDLGSRSRFSAPPAAPNSRSRREIQQLRTRVGGGDDDSAADARIVAAHVERGDGRVGGCDVHTRAEGEQTIRGEEMCASRRQVMAPKVDC